MNSSCGMCGRRTLESLTIDGPPLASRWTVDADTIGRLRARAARRTARLAETGGLHAAGVSIPPERCSSAPRMSAGIMRWISCWDDC